jgi:BMFP domain-containing protein YqiC
MNRLSRRKILCGAGGIAMALPFLDVMRPRSARAQDSVAPRRILFLFQANGDEVDTRFTDSGETTFQLGEFLRPLEPYRSELLFLNNVNRRFYELPDDQRSDNHQQGGSSLAPWTSGAGSFPIGGTEDQTIGYVEGPSADYAIGERVIAEDPTVAHRHLVYRVGDRSNNIWNLHAHAGPVGQQNPVAPETDPFAAYARIFSFPGSDPDAEAALRAQLQKRASAIDLVLSELGDLQNQVGAADRRKIEQHTEAMRDIERSLSTGSETASCSALDLGPTLSPYDDDNHAAIGELFFRISALAFACDRTRSINFNWSGNTSNRVYRNLDLSEGHHDISHEGTPDSFATIRRIHEHLWTQNTKLYELLKATPDGDGTLWDHTLIVHWNELGQGDSHSIDDSLVVLAGGAHGYFTKGRLVDYENDTSFSDMLVSCFHYMGFDDVTEFGDERLRLRGSLTGVTV